MTAAMAAAIPKLDADAVWQCLSEDAHVPLWLVDRSGRITFASKPAVEFLAPGQSVAGRSLADILPQDMADERLELVSRVAESGAPVLMFEMIRGRWSRTVMRRTGVGRSLRVLIINRIGWSDHHQVQADAHTGYELVEPKIHDAGLLAALSEREIEVLRLIGEGLTTAEIGARIQRTAKTVEWHRSALGRKLNVSSRIELARVAHAAGLHGGPSALKPALLARAFARVRSAAQTDPPASRKGSASAEATTDPTDPVRNE